VEDVEEPEVLELEVPWLEVVWLALLVVCPEYEAAAAAAKTPVRAVPPAAAHLVIRDTRFRPWSRLRIRCGDDIGAVSNARFGFGAGQPRSPLRIRSYRKSLERRAVSVRGRGRMRSATTLMTVSTRSRRPSMISAGQDRATLR
jgi:hypothetical protein